MWACMCICRANVRCRHWCGICGLTVAVKAWCLVLGVNMQISALNFTNDWICFTPRMALYRHHSPQHKYQRCHNVPNERLDMCVYVYVCVRYFILLFKCIIMCLVASNCLLIKHKEKRLCSCNWNTIVCNTKVKGLIVSMQSMLKKSLTCCNCCLAFYYYYLCMNN